VSTPELTATTGALVAPVVVVVDLLTARERHADELAFACATLLARLGGHDVSVTTHWAALGELRHVALVVEVSGLAPGAVADALTVLTSEGTPDGPALLVDGTSTGPVALRPVLAEVLEAHRTRSSGRAVVFPGSTTLTGTVTVADAVAGTAIDRVQVLGSAEPDGATALVTRGFVRPRWSGGRLVLHAQPAVGGALVPFETPDPTPCCADHA
jgi:hypothetical protein